MAGLCAIDAFYIEPYFPRVITQEVRIEGLPKSLDGLKIVQLSDLHIVKCGAREARALRLINRINPDLICLTGDYIEDDGITPGNYTWRDCGKEATRFMSSLHAKYGTYAVMGNWDRRELIPDFKGAGVHMIDGRDVTVRIRGGKMRISGDSRAAANGERKSVVPTIVLDHFPYAFDELALSRRHVDLVLSGHWHGGQVGWPLRMTDVKYLSGLYKIGRVQLYVTRGLGMHSLAVRFNCPAEVTLIVLRPA